VRAVEKSELAALRSLTTLERVARGAALSTAATIALIGAGAAAVAAPPRPHRPCSTNKGKLYPRVIRPCDGAKVPLGRRVTFYVHDENPLASNDHPFLDLVSAKPSNGILPRDHSGNGLFAELLPVKGRPGVFSVTPPAYTFTGYWLVTPGTYHVQVQQPDNHRSLDKNGYIYGPVTTITVH
jgi:hypothetical protein